jgi:hypothetical protein
MPLPQREGRPVLDIAPEATPDTAAWDEKFILPANPMNNPVPIHKGLWPVNGWTKANEHNEKDAGE